MNDGRLEGFVRISKYAGMREDLVQAGGGNSSFKPGDGTMVVKASGYQLSDMTDTEGYALVDVGTIKQAFLEKDGAGTAAGDCRQILEDALIKGGRPSIETFLHAVSGVYTLHTHPVVVNALTCRRSWRAELAGLFPEALLVPYATPGAGLAEKYFSACRECGGKVPDIVFLQNHGLVVSSGTADGVIEMTEAVVERIEEYLGCDFGVYHDLTRIWRLFPDKIVWKVSDANVLRVYREGHAMWESAFCPDCVVFLGKRAFKLLNLDSADGLLEFEKAYGDAVVVIYKDSLYLVADSVKKAMEIQSVLSFSAQVAELNKGVVCEFLSGREQDFLLGWDAERYRREMSV